MSTEDVKQEIYMYIMRFSLHKFMDTPEWLPNIKMMSRNLCSNFLQKVKSTKRKTNQYTIAEELCESSMGFCESPQSYLEFLDKVDYLPALRKDILSYLIESGNKEEKFTIAKLAQSFNLSPSVARKEYLGLQHQLGY